MKFEKVESLINRGGEWPKFRNEYSKSRRTEAFSSNLAKKRPELSRATSELHFYFKLASLIRFFALSSFLLNLI